jgi:hypothetical protein
VGKPLSQPIAWPGILHPAILVHVRLADTPRPEPRDEKPGAIVCLSGFS